MLSDKDYDLVQEFLRRRSELSRDSRARLGVQLANGLYARLGMTGSGGDQERFLEQLARDYRRHRAQATRSES
jgi:hypothetical protein